MRKRKEIGGVWHEEDRTNSPGHIAILQKLRSLELREKEALFLHS